MTKYEKFIKEKHPEVEKIIQNLMNDMASGVDQKPIYRQFYEVIEGIVEKSSKVLEGTDYLITVYRFGNMTVYSCHGEHGWVEGGYIPEVILTDRNKMIELYLQSSSADQEILFYIDQNMLREYSKTYVDNFKEEVLRE